MPINWIKYWSAIRWKTNQRNMQSFVAFYRGNQNNFSSYIRSWKGTPQCKLQEDWKTIVIFSDFEFVANRSFGNCVCVTLNCASIRQLAQLSINHDTSSKTNHRASYCCYSISRVQVNHHVKSAQPHMHYSHYFRFWIGVHELWIWFYAHLDSG